MRILFSNSIEYLRIIRDPTPNQYMCLIKFKSQVMLLEAGTNQYDCLLFFV